jgi:hypothetical protein
VYVHFGGVVYPGLLTLALCAYTDGGWLGAVVMLTQIAVAAVALRIAVRPAA